MLSLLYGPTLHLYMTTGKSIALTVQTFEGKVMSPLSLVTGIKPVPPASEVQSLNHWTTRDAPLHAILNALSKDGLKPRKEDGISCLLSFLGSYFPGDHIHSHNPNCGFYSSSQT